MQAGTLAVLLVAAQFNAALAQEISGRIEGSVVSNNGTPLPEAEIAVSSPGLLGIRSATTDKSGRFRIYALPVGTYQLTVRHIGSLPLMLKDISVRLGQTVSLPALVLPEALVRLNEIPVIAAAPRLDPSSTASRFTLDAQQLDALPVSRNFRDIAVLAPTSVPSFLGRSGGRPEGINIGGATGLENSYFVDGINITDVIHGGTSLDLPYNFVQQMEVKTGGSTAEDPQALGGVVNVVTPNGGERLEGGLFGFFSGDALRTDPQAVLGSTETGFRFYDVGGTVAGPLLKRRLRFFAAYDRTSERREHSLSFGGLNDIRRQHLFAGKLTWRAGPRTTAAFTLLGDPSDGEPLSFPILGSGVPVNPEVLQSKGRGGGVGLSLRGTHFLSERLYLEAAVSRIGRIDEVEPATPAGRQPTVVDALDGTIAGGTGISNRIDSHRWSVNLSASWHVGAHSFRAGALHEWLYMDQTIESTRAGSGGTITHQDTTQWSWVSVFGSGRAENRMPSLFAQDAWQVSSSLLINAGLRWSRQTVDNLSTHSVGFRVHDGALPRLGVVYQPDRTGRQRLYASYGRVANQIALWGAVANAFQTETLYVFPNDPRVDTAGTGIVYGLTTSGGFANDGTLRGETADEWAIGYERRLGSEIELSIRGVVRAHRDAVQVGRDTLGTLLWGNVGRGALAHFPLPERSYRALERSPGPRSLWLRLSYVLSRTYGNYPGLYGSDWRLDFAHYGPMYYVPEQHRNGTGLLPNDRTHLLKLFGSQRLGSAVVLGMSFLLASGTPLSEYGAIPGLPMPFRGLTRQRGTSGRTPVLWDLGFRLAYEVPVPARTPARARLLLDLEHIGSPRQPVDYEQIRFTCLDESGNQACPNAGYGRVIQYQEPMTARVGIEAGL